MLKEIRDEIVGIVLLNPKTNEVGWHDCTDAPVSLIDFQVPSTKKTYSIRIEEKKDPWKGKTFKTQLSCPTR